VLKPDDEIEVSNFIFTNGKEYSVQVSSWKSKDIADREAERFKSLGYKSAVVAANLNKLGTWYRVRVGYFSSIEKAKEFQNKQK
jgi:cell division protein FtsN